MYVYGFYECGRAVIDSKRVKTCQGREKSVYEMLETISDAQTLSDWCNKNSQDPAAFPDFLSIVGQIMYALMVAREHITDFSHCDLHTNNVLIRKLDKPYVIHYRGVGFQSKYVKTQWLATIIDFGRASMWLDNDSKLGYVNYSLGHKPGRAEHLYDVCRLLGCMVLRVNHARCAWRLKARDLFLPFMEDPANLRKFILNDLAPWEAKYNIVPAGIDIDIGEYIDFLVHHYAGEGVFLTDPGSIPEFSCAGGTCSRDLFV